MGYRHKSISKKGSGKKHNEDFIGILELEEGILGIVCDGIGGGLAAEKASKLCVESIQNTFLHSSEKNNLTKIRKCIKSANFELYEMSVSKKIFKGMATTSEVFFLNDHNVFWGHTGDSRIYNLKNGKLYQLTKDHSLVQEMLDRGYISMRTASKHPNKNVIMNALGESPDIEIDTSKLILNKNDQHRFMICSDGVTAILSNAEIERILNIKDLEKCIEELDKRIESGGKPDDYSIIIVELAD
jgi:protein phosphatase